MMMFQSPLTVKALAEVSNTPLSVIEKVRGGGNFANNTPPMNVITKKSAFQIILSYLIIP